MAGNAPEPTERSVEILEGSVRLPGDLSLPQTAAGLVVFAHGSGSGRSSPRNRLVARMLQRSALATLLLDLLTPSEAERHPTRFDIELLARRLAAAIGATRRWPGCEELPIGLFGASTGAAAALEVAAAFGDRIGAVVSRGGRPDLARGAFPRVKAPTLLIVGGEDLAVLDLNREALAALGPAARLEVVPGATHLFEEPGALEEVARLARDWFSRHLRRGRTGSSGGPGSAR
jgi:pimeloyl-ACP methyl ester carboxylesterase